MVQKLKMSENENVVDFKKQLIEWVNENINHPKLQESKVKVLDIIDLYNWEILCRYTENNWSKLDGPLGVGVSIYHKIQDIKASNGN